MAITDEIVSCCQLAEENLVVDETGNVFFKDEDYWFKYCPWCGTKIEGTT